MAKYKGLRSKEETSKLIEMLRGLRIGDKVYTQRCKTPYRVYYTGDKYIVIAKILYGSYSYLIIDLDSHFVGIGEKFYYDISFDENFADKFIFYLTYCQTWDISPTSKCVAFTQLSTPMFSRKRLYVENPLEHNITKYRGPQVI